MINQLKPAIIMFVLFTLLTGILYPLAVTGISQAAFPYQANGSLININKTLFGSKLIGQNFIDPQYFWGRPSATSGNPYTAFDPAALTGSSGSNLGPLSRILVERVRSRVEYLRRSDPGNTLPIPIDLVTSSASGLDPHISLSAAYWQVTRVARTRGMKESAVIKLIDEFKESRQFGFLGEPRVNVLLLNLALDGIE
jgi:potassium-transporting ATPase KdpC subunit